MQNQCSNNNFPFINFYGIVAAVHQSQKDNVPFQSSDNRAFWQRAEELNASTAELYSLQGLTRYAAMEAFVRWHY